MKSATEQKKAPFTSGLERVRSLNRQVKDRLAEATPPGGSSSAKRLAQIMARSNEIREMLKSPRIGYDEARKLLDEGNRLWREADNLVSDIDQVSPVGDSVAKEASRMVRIYQEGRAKGGFFVMCNPCGYGSYQHSTT
jgi:hypothetical protein